MSKVSVKPLSGMREFLPQEVMRRQHIFNTLRDVFERFGYAPIETPGMERLEVLTGKYGDEGDMLIFKVLNSGNYLKKVKDEADFEDHTKLLPQISERALRYDLTVPFARFVVNNRNALDLPFKRYQIQPVWRADRPQKGRYREFWQCDVDVVGTDSLLAESEYVQMYDQALGRLGLRDFEIRVNHRGLLLALAQKLGAEDKYTDMCVAIDKLDKIGREKVEEELKERGIAADKISELAPLFELQGDAEAQVAALNGWLGDTEAGPGAISDLQTLLNYLAPTPLQNGKLIIDPTLARGLNYYTGCIFEVKASNPEFGSIGGGGRYDDLTGMFGWDGLSGVGISFGADRIYDLMEAEGLFEDVPSTKTRVLMINFGGKAEAKSVEVAARLRLVGIPTEVYPDNDKKIGKQFGYADSKGIPYVLIIGEKEVEAAEYQLKDMAAGQQEALSLDDIVERVRG